MKSRDPEITPEERRHAKRVLWSITVAVIVSVVALNMIEKVSGWDVPTAAEVLLFAVVGGVGATLGIATAPSRRK